MPHHSRLQHDPNLCPGDRVRYIGNKAQVGRGAYRQASQAVQALLRGLVYNVHRVIALNTS